MTHTIFVPVSEFLANGGILNYGRSICDQFGKEVGWFGTDIQPVQNASTIEIHKIGRTFQSLTDIAFVEIEVVPIYK